MKRKDETPHKRSLGLVRYKHNPFMKELLTNLKPRVKRIANTTGDKLMIVSEDTGEILANAGFQTFYEVDQAKFVKMYIQGVRAQAELTNAGSQAFELLYLEVQNNVGKECVYLSYQIVEESSIEKKMSRTTYWRGMKELIEKGFIAESFLPNMYFVNPNFMYNGNRLTLAKTYLVKGKAKKPDFQTMSLFEDLDTGTTIEGAPTVAPTLPELTEGAQ